MNHRGTKAWDVPRFLPAERPEPERPRQQYDDNDDGDMRGTRRRGRGGRRTGGGETGRAIVIGGTWRLFSSKTPAPLIASKKYARGGAKTLPLKSAWLVARQRQSATRVTIHDASAGASSSALATDRQVRLAGTARGRCALSGLSRLGPLFVPAAGTLLRMDTLVDDDGEAHIGTVHVEASAFLVQAVVHHLGKRHNCTTSSDFE